MKNNSFWQKRRQISENIMLFENRYYSETLFGNPNSFLVAEPLFVRILFESRARSAPEKKVKIFGTILFGNKFENIIREKYYSELT